MDSPCGAEGVGLRICPLLSCTRDIESHLVSLGLGSKRGATSSKVSEADLILNLTEQVNLMSLKMKRGE